MLSFSTVAMGNDVDDRCLTSGSPDVQLAWVAAATATYRVLVEGADFDPAVSVVPGACGDETLDCSRGTDGRAEVVFEASAGQTFLFIVEGESWDDAGTATLSVEPI